MKADLKARRYMHDFRRHYGCRNLCDSCLAERGVKAVEALNYKNFAPSAAYPMTQLSHNAYMDIDAGHISPWECVEGWRLETLSWDLLHVLFLGTGRDVFASALHALLQHGVLHPANDREAALDNTHREMANTCQQHGSLFMAFL